MGLKVLDKLYYRRSFMSILMNNDVLLFLPFHFFENKDLFIFFKFQKIVYTIAINGGN